MKYIRTLFLFAFLGSFTFCRHTEHKTVSEVSCEKYLTDSITFPCKPRSVIYGNNEKNNIYFYNDEDNHRVIRFNGFGAVIDTISYSLPNGKTTGFCAITSDSFAFLQPKGLFLYGVKLKSSREFKIDRHGMNCYSLSFLFPLEMSDSLAFFYSSEDTMVLNTTKNWELYMDSSHVETVLNLNKDKLENIKAGEYPKEIYDDSNCYYSITPSRCLNYRSHELVYLYKQSDTLYVFNYLTRTLRKAPIKNPDFLPNEKYDMNKMGDFDYLSQYETENSRNAAITYNKFKNEYYVIFYPKCSYKNANSDEVTNPIDKPWSVLVLDSNFTLKTKINFPAKKYYFASLSLQQGFLVGYYSNFHTTTSAKYAVLEF